MVKAAKSRDAQRLGVIRLLRSDIKNREIELGRELEDDDVISVLSQAARKHRESIEQFEHGGRAELVEKEKGRLAIVEEYLPEQLSDAELTDLVRGVIRDLGAAGPGDLGRVMGSIMPEVRGRADGSAVRTIVQTTLSEIDGD